MVLHLPTHWAFKNPLWYWSRYRDANPVPTKILADDITTVPSGLPFLSLSIGRMEGRKDGRKEGNVLLNNVLNTVYLRLYSVRHMVKDHSDSERGNPLPPHRLFFPISSKGSFICIIPQTG